MELINEAIWADEIYGAPCTVRTWTGYTYDVDVMEFDGFARILRLDVDEEHRGKGLGTEIVQTLKDKYGKLIAAPKDESSRRFFEKVGEKDEWGVLMGELIFPFNKGYGIYLME